MHCVKITRIPNFPLSLSLSVFLSVSVSSPLPHQLLRLEGHSKDVTAMLRLPPGAYGAGASASTRSDERILTSSLDGTLRLWDVSADVMSLEVCLFVHLLYTAVCCSTSVTRPFFRRRLFFLHVNIAQPCANFRLAVPFHCRYPTSSNPCAETPSRAWSTCTRPLTRPHLLCCTKFLFDIGPVLSCSLTCL